MTIAQNNSKNITQTVKMMETKLNEVKKKEQMLSDLMKKSLEEVFSGIQFVNGVYVMFVFL
jgi:ribosomal protein S2